MTAVAHERALLQAAGRGDEEAFRRLVGPYRAPLHAHCYRMLGSVHDADDALQDTLLRAWRALDRFEARSSLRSWLYTIATNVCLNAIARRQKRVLPADHGPPADPREAPGRPVVESVWIEPYPDETLGLADELPGPDARYELRESVELAFVAALQHLPPLQRAVLILRDVLGYSAKETAEVLSTTPASVNSAMQRARAAVDERVPAQTQQATLRALGDDAVAALVDRYVEAWENCDVDAFVGMLAEDATFTMPPLASWYDGREAIEVWAKESSLSGEWRWRTVATRANGQPALGFYVWDPAEGGHLPFALNVLTFRGDRIADVTAFIVRVAQVPDEEVDGRWPDQPSDPGMLDRTFARFGLPDRVA